MDITEQRSGAVVVLAPKGPISQRDADQFRSRAQAVLAKSMGRFVVDLSAAPFADSRGLEVLADLSDELVHSGQALKLCGVNETLREVFALTDIAPMFEQYEDVHSAVRSFL